MCAQSEVSGTTDHSESPEYLSVGDLGVDSVARIDHLPRVDEKLWLELAGDYPGGMMGNAAATAAALGISAGVAAMVGSDARGDLVVDALVRRDVDTRFVQPIDEPTFWTLSLTTPSGDRTLLQFPTKAFGVDWAALDTSMLTGTRWLHTAAEQGEQVRTILEDARGWGATTSLDIEYPFVLRKDLPDLLEFVDVAFLNAGAADALGGAEQAASYVQEQGAGTAVITLGERGAFLLERSGQARDVAPHEVTAVDTNGAGDAFAAAYAAARLKGFDEADAAELAAVVAAVSTTVTGGFGPTLTTADVRAIAEEGGYGWWQRL